MKSYNCSRNFLKKTKILFVFVFNKEIVEVDISGQKENSSCRLFCGLKKKEHLNILVLFFG